MSEEYLPAPASKRKRRKWIISGAAGLFIAFFAIVLSNLKAPPLIEISYAGPPRGFGGFANTNLCEFQFKNVGSTIVMNELVEAQVLSPTGWVTSVQAPSSHNRLFLVRPGRSVLLVLHQGDGVDPWRVRMVYSKLLTVSERKRNALLTRFGLDWLVRLFSPSYEAFSQVYDPRNPEP